VMGVDIAGPEKEMFTPGGMESFKELYAQISQAAKMRKRGLVLRPHVGEGYNDGIADHAKVAEHNLQMLIDTLEAIGYSEARGQQDMVMIRLGHMAHATTAQMRALKRLGVMAEANIGSNDVTGALAEDEHKLLYNLYFDIPTVLGTDAGGVMNTTKAKEYKRAEAILSEFRSGDPAATLDVDGKAVEYKDLTPAQQGRFTLDYIKATEDRYHTNVMSDDTMDTTRRQGGTP